MNTKHDFPQVVNADKSHDAVDDLCSSLGSHGPEKEFLIVENFSTMVISSVIPFCGHITNLDLN